MMIEDKAGYIVGVATNQEHYGGLLNTGNILHLDLSGIYMDVFNL